MAGAHRDRDDAAGPPRAREDARGRSRSAGRWRAPRSSSRRGPRTRLVSSWIRATGRSRGRLARRRFGRRRARARGSRSAAICAAACSRRFRRCRAVRTTASRPPITAAYAPTYLRTRCANTLIARRQRSSPSAARRSMSRKSGPMPERPASPALFPRSVSISSTDMPARSRWARSADIEVARARAHDEAVERGETHARLGGVAELDRARARAIAQMKAHDSEIRERATEVLRGELGDVRVARPVEAVAANAVFVRDLRVDRVGLGAAWEARVERGVEHGDLRRRRERAPRRADAGEVVRVVERRERDTLSDRCLDRVVDEGRLVEAGPAVDDAVTDGVDGAAPHLLHDRRERLLVREHPLAAGAPAPPFRGARPPRRVRR